MNYLSAVKRKKKSLDQIFIENKAQPVGWGYIDTIVTREYYKIFIEMLSSHGFLIEAVSWWDYINNDNDESQMGMGGPRSIYFSGYFAELVADFNEFDQKEIDIIMKENNSEKIITANKRILDIVENKKTYVYVGGKFMTFKKDISLTPGFWIVVPKDWVNPYHDNITKDLLDKYKKVIKIKRLEIKRLEKWF